MRKKNKGGFLLAEETLKIVIALIALTFLIYFLMSLYFAKTSENDDAITDLQQRVAALENPPTPSPSPLLLENFNGSTLDTNPWEVFDNGGTYNFDNGFVVIPGGSNVPFIRAKNNIKHHCLSVPVA